MPVVELNKADEGKLPPPPPPAFSPVHRESNQCGCQRHEHPHTSAVHVTNRWHRITEATCYTDQVMNICEKGQGQVCFQGGGGATMCSPAVTGRVSRSATNLPVLCGVSYTAASVPLTVRTKCQSKLSAQPGTIL